MMTRKRKNQAKVKKRMVGMKKKKSRKVTKNNKGKRLYTGSEIGFVFLSLCLRCLSRGKRDKGEVKSEGQHGSEREYIAILQREDSIWQE